ncbi:hypothetical protein Nos7524_5323 [Nostoc sp. PCC 7524]|uniref:hypothetical protein n=1 Tax=Nostoc sp. (strain ATCC 29411 / PCC 7524) TaxID=28072 RepID=UPI00029F2072|nr:hypothetical protein [Nostoc sp. PCC 7524]AFY51044.1 hypothetical protein Nos7524_5323 [Nostoc sp. PCC 7524]
MQTIRVRSRIGKNGLLQIQLPQTSEGTELDIILVYEPVSPTKDTGKISDRFYGIIQDDTFFRHPQPEQPEREAF